MHLANRLILCSRREIQETESEIARIGAHMRYAKLDEERLCEIRKDINTIIADT